MSRSSFRRRIPAVVLGLTLAAHWAMASETQSRPTGSSPARPAEISAQASLNLFSKIWSLLTSMWNKNGCRVDPNGICVSQQGNTDITVGADNGCSGDPNGHCLSGQ